MTSKSILVVGGHGFLGKHVVNAANREGYTVTAASSRDGLDLLNLTSVEDELARMQPHVIINCAAHVGSLHYVTTHAATVAHENVQMALNLYRAVQNRAPGAVVINPLSNCSYPGEADIHYEPDWWMGEVHSSVHAYGNSKRFIYVLASAYQKQHGIRSFNFLVSNAFGPGDYADPNKTHAINGMIIRMLQARQEGRPTFEIWGTGRPVREWAYIEDVARLLVESIKLDQDLTYPVNVAQNRGYSIGESARMIANAIGFKGDLVFNTKYQDGAMRKVLDDRKFKQIFPYFKFCDHEKGIQETVAYYEKALV